MKLNHTTLRAIGQDLETIGLFDFDLELEGERCVICGMAVAAASPEPSPPSRGVKAFWKQFWNTESDVPLQGAPVPVERVYLSDDIDRLVAEGQSRRRDRQSGPKKQDRPELYSIGEMLRVFGAYCETKELQLVSVSKRESRLKYEYLTELGVRGAEERAFSDLLDFGYGLSLKRSERGPERDDD